MMTLVPPALRPGLQRYTTLFRGSRDGPHPTGFFVPAVLARLGVAMTGLGLLLAVERATGSYAVAGAATGTFAVAEAVAGPQLARVVDRFGQTRTVPPVVTAHAIAITTALLAAGTAPHGVVIAVLAVAGATVPQPGALSAARWLHALPEGDGLRAAFSLEATVNDVAFLTGPVVVTAAAALVSPVVGSVLAAGCLLLGCLAMAAHRGSAPPARPPTRGRRRRTSLRHPQLLATLGVHTGLGCFFGAVPVLVTAAARTEGAPALAGIVLASSSAASLCAGLGYGALRDVPPPRTVQLLAAAALVVAVGLGALCPTLAGLTVMLAVGGTAIAPLVASSAQVVGEVVAEDERTQGFTWVNTASAAGLAGAAGLTGVLVERGGVPLAALALLPLVAVALASALVARVVPLGTRPTTGTAGSPTITGVSTLVRLAGRADLALLEEIENEADLLLVQRLRPDRWDPAPTGSARASAPGYLLVAETEPGVLVGFAHVVETHGVAHLEQLSVRPEHGRRGYGRLLVEAAKEEARRRGHDRLTLRTYADVPWNAPFYARLGFVEEEAATPFHQSLVQTEVRLGLGRYGRRVQMVAELR